MLVAVAIVVIMMTLFATIFQMATGAMSKQKGLSENDQRVRLVMTMLRNDLRTSKTDPVYGGPAQHRTFKVLIPYASNEGLAPTNPLTGAPSAASDRAGYFHISEGNTFNDTDDILQLTIEIPLSSNDRIFGRAAGLLPDVNGKYGDPNANPAVGMPLPLPALSPPGNWWPNQPEFDDLLGYPNQAGSSTDAEVSYFLRNGTLYRRVMLIRLPNVTVPPAPNPAAPNDYAPSDDASPTPNDLSLSTYTGGTRGLWNDFDYSVFYNPNTGKPQFHGISDLSAGLYTLFNPQNRWGFDGTTNATSSPVGGGGYGLPREYDSSSNFFGRFTHLETSDVNFGYPAVFPGPLGGNPMASGTSLTLSNGVLTSGAVATFPSGPRVGEDALMNNVLAFDIKVWDPAVSVGPDNFPGIAGFDDDGINGIDDYGELGAYGSDDGDWRDIGHAGFSPSNTTNTPGQYYAPPFPQQQVPYGWYCVNAAKQTYFTNTGAAVPVNRYDTWGPAVEIDGNPLALDQPPYQPLYAGPDGQPGIAATPPNGPNAFGAAGSDDFAPLTAIKITIRFYDVTSNQVRDISGVFRLTFEP